MAEPPVGVAGAVGSWAAAGAGGGGEPRVAALGGCAPGGSGACGARAVRRWGGVVADDQARCGGGGGRAGGFVPVLAVEGGDVLRGGVHGSWGLGLELGLVLAYSREGLVYPRLELLGGQRTF